MFFGWLDTDCYAHHCLAIELDNRSNKININKLSDLFKKNLCKINSVYEDTLQKLTKNPHIILLKPGTMKHLQKQKTVKAGFVGHTKVKKIINFNDAISLIKRNEILDDNLPIDIVNKFNAI